MKLIVAVSADVPLDDDELLLWGIFTRFDCARDVIPAATESRGAWLTCRGPLGIDATWKAGYPEPIENPPEVIARGGLVVGQGVILPMTALVPPTNPRSRMSPHQASAPIFGVPRPLIGMIHLGALPGSPAGRLSMDALIDAAILEAETYRSAGFHGLIIENMHDRPYLKGHARPETVAAMAAIGRESCARCGFRSASRSWRRRIARRSRWRTPAGGSFVRVEGFVFAHVADEGLIDAGRRRAAPLPPRDRRGEHQGVRRRQEEALRARADRRREPGRDRAGGRVLLRRRRDRDRRRDR